jgi:hypothetical protein
VTYVSAELTARADDPALAESLAGIDLLGGDFVRVDVRATHDAREPPSGELRVRTVPAGLLDPRRPEDERRECRRCGTPFEVASLKWNR